MMKSIFSIIVFFSDFVNLVLNKIKEKRLEKIQPFLHLYKFYSTVTDLARFLGLSTSQPRVIAA